MIVFRIEHELDRIGPYQDRAGVVIITDVCKDYERHEKILPSCMDDGLPHYDGISAFPSIEALKKWFTAEEIWLMMGLGYKIKKIKAKNVLIGISGLQCKLNIEDIISVKVIDPTTIL